MQRLHYRCYSSLLSPPSADVRMFVSSPRNVRKPPPEALQVGSCRPTSRRRRSSPGTLYFRLGRGKSSKRERRMRRRKRGITTRRPLVSKSRALREQGVGGYGLAERCVEPQGYGEQRTKQQLQRSLLAESTSTAIRSYLKRDVTPAYRRADRPSYEYIWWIAQSSMDDTFCLHISHNLSERGLTLLLQYIPILPIYAFYPPCPCHGPSPAWLLFDHD